jgi:hypothetical protein
MWQTGSTVRAYSSGLIGKDFFFLTRADKFTMAS